MKKKRNAVSGTTLLGMGLLSDHFRHLRKQRGLTRKQVSEVTGVSLEVIRRFETRAPVSITRHLLIKLGKAVHCRPAITFTPETQTAPLGGKQALAEFGRVVSSREGTAAIANAAEKRGR